MRFPGLKFGIVALAVVLLTLGLAAASLPLWLEPHKDRLAALISDALGRKPGACAESCASNRSFHRPLPGTAGGADEPRLGPLVRR